MKIEMTEQQFETIRSALITGQCALNNIAKELREENKIFMACYRENQMRDMEKALEVSSWDKVKIIKE
jgi:uncharacterized membrane protein (DUF106 family)